MIEGIHIQPKVNKSLIIMDFENETLPQTSSLCLLCDMYSACQKLQGLCSSCYKISIQSPRITQRITLKALETNISNEILKQPLKLKENGKRQQIDRKRCFTCNRQVKLLGIQCKCGLVFCNGHRLPEQHDCDFDFKRQGKEQLKKEIVKCYNGKIAQI